MQETVTLNTQDQKRVLVLNQILAGHLSTAEAAPLLNKSKRQMQRLVEANRKEGVEAFVRGDRGRSARWWPDQQAAAPGWADALLSCGDAQWFPLGEPEQDQREPHPGANG